MVYAYGVSSRSFYAFPLAYFMGWILFYHITGAEFNPAISLASFITMKQYNKGKQLAFTLIAQYLGSLFGIFMVFILLKYQGRIFIYPDLITN